MTCYEFALACDVKPYTPKKVISTLEFMTGTQDCEFETSLKHSLFADKDGIDYLADWKIIISNSPTGGVEDQPGLFGSIFKYPKLNVRKFVGDDEFYNAFPNLIDWLASICISTGFVGYYYRITDRDLGFPESTSQRQFSNPVLIYFQDGKALERSVEGELRELFSGDPSSYL